MDKFYNRTEAGKKLASLLKKYDDNQKAIVLALPRGGVPVAYEIAKELSLFLGVFIVRKLGAPGYEELALGAIASGNILLLNQEIVNSLKITDKVLQTVIEKETLELKRRENLYAVKTQPSLKSKIILLVDDGVATGATIKTAIKALRRKKPLKIIIAVPVAAESSYLELLDYADDVICPLKPKFFSAVGLWYEDFSQTTDDEVRALLKKSQLQ